MNEINYELNIPWFARLDHLEHRMWIEESEANTLWKGKTSYNRISHVRKNSKPFEVVPLRPVPKEKYPAPISNINSCFKHYKRTTYTAHQVSQPAFRKGKSLA
ncbi:S-linalool synthase, partial [Mucuna pruriens]